MQSLFQLMILIGTKVKMGQSIIQFQTKDNALSTNKKLQNLGQIFSFKY